MKITSYILTLGKSTKNKLVYEDTNKGISFYVPKADMPAKPPVTIQVQIEADGVEEGEDGL